MIVSIGPGTLSSIRNPVFRRNAEMYVQIYADFLAQISRLGMELEKDDASPAARQKIKRLHSLGADVRNDEKSITMNRISPSCIACRTSEGSATFFISLRCHRNCFYCFNPNQEDYTYYQEHKRNLVKELEDQAAAGQALDHIALTGGEPLLHRDETIQFFQSARRLFPQAYTRLYTSGDHLDMSTLQALQAAGLQEIRISIRMYDRENGHQHTYKQLALAKEFIPRVMVEMPVLPGTLEEMKVVVNELERLGIFGINLLEFCFPLSRPAEFDGRGFKLKAAPFRVLYNYWYAGGLPVAGSEDVCLDLLEYALDEGLSLGLHYCSLENKHTGQIYQQNFNQRLGKTAHFSQKDFFIKTAKVFGEDIPRAKPLLYKARRVSFDINPEHHYLEFHPRYIDLLKPLDIEVGISTNVFETRQDGKYLRELKLDLTTPQTFDYDFDV